MTDQQIDETYLRQELAAGRLARGNLLFAAYLGDEGARRVAEGDAPPEGAGLWEWVEGIRAAGLLPLARASVAAARALLDRVAPDDPLHEPLDATIATTEDYLVAPTSKNGKALVKLAETSGLPIECAWASQTTIKVYHNAAHAASSSPGQVAGSAANAAASAASALGARLSLAANEAEALVRAAIAADLIPWVLGSVDPVAERRGSASPKRRQSKKPPARPKVPAGEDLEVFGGGPMALVDPDRFVPLDAGEDWTLERLLAHLGAQGARGAALSWVPAAEANWVVRVRAKGWSKTRGARELTSVISAGAHGLHLLDFDQLAHGGLDVEGDDDPEASRRVRLPAGRYACRWVQLHDASSEPPEEGPHFLVELREAAASDSASGEVPGALEDTR
ncbi:MAG: hypothetical protein KF878_30240 [Planctomycetes bacterium]|nr:hypothetical protein [Planctomycetota bacterium]